MPDDATLPVRCAHCAGAVLLQFENWTPTNPPTDRVQPWVCPYCWKKNEGTFPALLKSATKNRWDTTAG